MYDDVLHIRAPYDDVLVTKAREQITSEIAKSNHMSDWYTTSNWNNLKYDYCDLLFNKETFELISLNGNNIIQDDLSLKILCRFYVVKKHRKRYPSIHQVIIIPKSVDFALHNGLKSVWYSFHRFDKRHQRYSDSQKRLINGSKIPEQYMPYWKSFEFVGVRTWNGVEQDKFEYKL